jgi:hypothetical protein
MMGSNARTYTEPEFKLIKRKVGGYGTVIPLADNAPVTISLICCRNGFGCSESSVSSSAPLSSSLDDVFCESLSSPSDPDEPEDSSLSLLDDDDSSSLSEFVGAGDIGALFCVGDVLSALLPLSLLDGELSSLLEGSDAGDVLPCGGSCEGRSVEVCACTDFWLPSIVVSMTVKSSSTAVIAPNFMYCWMLINFFSKAAS